MNLRPIELKAFVPSTDFARSKQFYLDLGFTLASDGGGIAYFHLGHLGVDLAFLLQDFDAPGLAQNFCMHLLVEDVDAWHATITASGIAARYGTTLTDIVQQPWRMRDFILHDPCGVQWRIAQNTD